jgi:hypothetical protein
MGLSRQEALPAACCLLPASILDFVSYCSLKYFLFNNIFK